MRGYPVFILALSLAAAVALADLSGSYILPLDDETIQYTQRVANDPVARLNQRIASGEVQLTHDDQQGYLRSVLEALRVPRESQVLVFSKTSFQASIISPRKPRAIYFSDSTAVGFVQSSDVLEFASVDPWLGPVFYTLSQEKTAKPRFERRDTSCLQCHDAGATLGVPGFLIRSVYPDASGMPIFEAGDFFTDHRSPLPERWGGWYVTGTHARSGHMGNAVVRDRDHPQELELSAARNVTDLTGKFDVRPYLTPHSDIVALLTLEHQVRMTNLITRVGYETLMALDVQSRFNRAYHQAADEMSESTRHRIDSAVEELVQYMLFTNEAQLDAPVKGTSGFAEAFSKAGLRDSQGRSLRDFDLQTRLFRYPLSYMIYSEAFDQMPEAARSRIYRRIFDVLSGDALTGNEKSSRYATLTAADRRAVLQILRETKEGLPEYWK